MDTIYLNSKSNKTLDPYRVLLHLRDKTKRSDKYVALSNPNIYCAQKNIKKSYKNNKFKVSFPSWNEKLPDGSYSVSDIQDYFEYII